MSSPASELELCPTQDGSVRAHMASTGSDLLVMGGMQAGVCMPAVI